MDEKKRKGRRIPVLNSMEKTRDTRFLKNYTLNYTNKEGGEKIYETVSNFDYNHPEELGERPSGVVVVGYCGDKLLLCREFRMGVNHFVYNLPAGHIDEGEDVEACARRELYEETGLSISEVKKVLPPSYAAPDLSDSSAWVVFAEVEGEISDHTEADEWIQPDFYDREEVSALLSKERFSGRAQMVTYFFLRSSKMEGDMTEMTKITDKKIAVVGVGGVGGYLAGMLGKTCPHLTVVARGNRKESIQKCGLRLHSEDKGEICIRPETVVEGSALSEQDYIFICVKNYSLEQVCREISEAVADHTVVIPVMNGVNPGERARKYLGNGTVVDSLIYIVAFANEDFSVTQQGAPARLCVGVQDGDAEEKAAVDEVRKLLQAADIDCMATADIQVEIWRKYILNCAYNVATAYYDNTIGQLREDGRKAEEYEMLVREAGKVALAKKVAILPEHLEEIINKFRYEHAYEATSSLQRDIRAGRKTELDVFSGYLVREAGKYGIPVPVSEKMYLGLKKIVAKQNEKS